MAYLLSAGQDEVEMGFERGSRHCYHFRLKESLGDLRRLHVQQVSSNVFKQSPAIPPLVCLLQIPRRR